MTSLLKTDFFITPEEYLEGEQYSDIRHEYIDGVVYAMAGGTRNHNIVSGNVFARLHGQVGDPCIAYMADVKVTVKTLASESYYYPDVVVSCAEDDKNPQFLEKPTTIVEVLSDSTERTDRKEKFLAYTSLPSLEEYILISQDKKLITVARRKNDWQPENLVGDDFALAVSCSDEPLTSAAIYKNVEF